MGLTFIRLFQDSRLELNSFSGNVNRAVTTAPSHSTNNNKWIAFTIQTKASKKNMTSVVDRYNKPQSSAAEPNKLSVFISSVCILTELERTLGGTTYS